MKRFSWQEMQAYWRLYESRYSEVDWERDPEGLGVVCHIVPVWLNQYYARFQRLTFQKLLAHLPASAGRGARALDVGCGTGRWCRFLAERGYEAVGIDLRSNLIDENRRRDPHIAYVCDSIQEFTADVPFNLISSVTVIQHIPFQEQGAVIQKLRVLLNVGGYAIVLENVQDQGPHVFSNSIDGWRAHFAQAGFRELAIQRYDYSPLLRLQSWLARKFTILRRRPEPNGASLTPESLVTHWGEGSMGGAQGRPLGVHLFAKRCAVVLDTPIEAALVHSNVALPTVHCGFLFEAV